VQSGPAERTSLSFKTEREPPEIISFGVSQMRPRRLKRAIPSTGCSSDEGSSGHSVKGVEDLPA
jgi:hypothetical protein